MKIDCGSREILSIQDAYFDSTYEHLNGSCMDYFDLLKLLQQRRHKDIVTVSGVPPPQRDQLYFHENETVTKTRGFWTLEECEEQSRLEWSSFCSNRGFPGDILYMHLSILSIGGLSGEESAEFISKLHELGLALEIPGEVF